MEAVVVADSPLAAYLEGEGEGEGEGKCASHQGFNDDLSPATPPHPSFAPRGIPQVRQKIRQDLPPPLRLRIPKHTAVAVIHEKCSEAVNSTIGRAENERFLEQFRYLIVASQLLSTHSLSQNGPSRSHFQLCSPDPPQMGACTLGGAALTALYAFSFVWLINWARGKQGSRLAKTRIALVVCLIIALAILMYAYVRRQWLQYLRQQTIRHTSNLLIRSQNFDAVASGALLLVQEVELVCRGYRISIPLPPITRLEDGSQTRRCARIRKMLRLYLADAVNHYVGSCVALRPLVEPMDLERYYDVYDLSALDLSEASSGYSESEFDDTDSLQNLKILASRFSTIRKVFLCTLLAIDAHGGKPDFVRWSAALDEIQALDSITGNAETQLRKMFEEEQNFPVPPTPQLPPLTPGRERWRAQLRKLNSLSSGIRGLQAKLHVVREETDLNLNDTGGVSEFGTNLLIQFESIGMDLKALMQEWEEAKAALVINLDRTEKRMSATTGLLSPAVSLGGRTAVEDGTTPESVKGTTDKNHRSSCDLSSSDAEEVFEAVAIPRPRSTLTREERIAKMQEQRASRLIIKDHSEANTRMLRELQTVINLRPRGRTNPSGRVTSL